ncbi:PE-PGRS family protein [Rhizobium binxianense]
MPIPQISDTIHLSDPNAGNANAGNGGDGYSFGDIHYSPTAYVANTQAVEGAYTDLHNGDHVWQMADWDAGGGGSGGLSQAQNGFLAAVTNNGDGGAGGSATSNGNQGAATGGDTAAVAADTTATQYTQLLADQHATILAGVGGNGGNGNMAQGGDISAALLHTDPTTTTTSVANTLENFDNAFGHIDLSHIGS